MGGNIFEGQEKEINTIYDNPKECLIEKAYNRYVSELRHEDSLINHRLSWLLIFQGFLLASVGSGHLTAPLFCCVTAVGFFSSLFTLVSIRAAINAWKSYHKNLEEILSHHFSNPDDEVIKLFPQWKRSTSVITCGHWTSQGVCVLFSTIWIIFFLLFVCGILDNFFKS